MIETAGQGLIVPLPSTNSLHASATCRMICHDLLPPFCSRPFLFLSLFVVLTLLLILPPQAEDARQIKIASPVLNAAELAAIRDLEGFKTATLPTVYPLEKGPGGLKVFQPCVLLATPFFRRSLFFLRRPVTG